MTGLACRGDKADQLWSMVMLTAFPVMGARRSLAVDARDALLFGACYLALVWASSIYPLGPGIRRRH